MVHRGTYVSSHHPHFAHRPPSDEGVARVYHYTTVEGARSIIAGRELSGRHTFHYMNDYTEYTHGIEAMQHLSIGWLRRLRGVNGRQC